MKWISMKSFNFYCFKRKKKKRRKARKERLNDGNYVSFHSHAHTRTHTPTFSTFLYPFITFYYFYYYFVKEITNKKLEIRNLVLRYMYKPRSCFKTVEEYYQNLEEIEKQSKPNPLITHTHTFFLKRLWCLFKLTVKNQSTIWTLKAGKKTSTQ